MTRPLMQHGVGQLEEMFASSKQDLKVLKQLEQELQYRQVPRAVSLLAEVQGVLYGAKPAAPQAVPAPSNATRQQDLWGPAPAAKPPVAPAVPQPRAVAAAVPARTATVAPSAGQEAPPMSVEDACKVLKVTPGASWVSIEQARRQLVEQASPARTSSLSAERRAQLLADARRVNAAYASLARGRERGR